MTEIQITALLVAGVAMVIGYRAYRRHRATKHDIEEMNAPEGKTVSYATGRDESQWRRAYSRG